MTPELRSLLQRTFERLHREHIGHLLELGDKALRQIDVSRPGTTRAAFESLLSTTSQELARHLTSLLAELLAVIEGTHAEITSEIKLQIVGLATTYLDASLYSERLKKFEESIGRHFGRAGRSFNIADVRTDLIASRLSVGSQNQIIRFTGHLADKLEVVVQRQAFAAASMKSTEKREGKLEQANRFVKLEPNVFGIGFNLNYLIRRLFGRKE